MTTADSVLASVAQLARARSRLLVQGDGFAAALDGDLDPLVAPSEAHAFVEAGSVGGGLRGRLTFPGGLSLLAGLGVGQQDYRDVSTGAGVSGTLAVRYAPAALGGSRPFVEIGGLVGGGGTAAFSRGYVNGAGVAVGKGSASYQTSAIWGRAGWIWDVGADGQLGAFVEVEGVREAFGGYVEPLSNANPFEAHVQPGSASMTVGKAGLRFSDTAAGGWSYGAALTLATAFAQSQDLQVAVPGFGAVPAGSVGRQTWVEFGARVGHAVTRNSTLSLFVTGVEGGGLVGGSAHGGIDYRVSF